MNPREHNGGGATTISNLVKQAAWDLGWGHGWNGAAPYPGSDVEDSDAQARMLADVLAASQNASRMPSPGLTTVGPVEALTPRDREEIYEQYASGWDRGHADRPTLNEQALEYHHEPIPEPPPGRRTRRRNRR